MATRRATLTIFAAALACLMNSVAASQIPSGHVIHGKVRNTAGYNMPHIRVDLEAGNGPLIQQTVTNNEGDFYFSNLSDTSYAVIVSAPDYETVTERVDFFRQAANAPGETRLIEITLVPKGGVRAPRAGLNFVQVIPKAAQASYERALQFSKQGKKAEAVAALQGAIRIFPAFFNAHLVLGNEFLHDNKYNEAIAEFEQARRINPKDDRPYELFGIALVREGKFVLAARVFAEAADLNPLEPQYPFMRAVALVEHVSSTKIVSPAKLDSDSSYALAEAEKTLLHAYDISHKKLSAVHFQLARVYEKKGERERAASELEEYLRENPNLTNAAAIRDAIKKLRAPIQHP